VRALAARLLATRFGILSRAFFAQFFTSEIVTSEMQWQKTMAGPLAFLLTPALLMPFQIVSTFEMAALRFPQLLEALTRMVATIFILYSMVAVGVIAAVMWDALAFDRRDAMVLGPLPLRASTVIGAKLAAMGALLLIVAVTVNVLFAVSFSMVAGNHAGLLAVVRLFVAHMTTAMTASTFVFCLIVTLRALVGGVSGRRVALASVLRFLLFSALLCFIIFVPTAFNVTPGGRRRQPGLQMQTLPAWSPSNWFLGLYDWLRGAPDATWDGGARLAVGITAAMFASAVGTTIAGYRRQLQLALTPSADAAHGDGAAIPRAIARVLTRRSRRARAGSDFIVTTLARNGAQQATIAVNAALGLTLVVAGLLRSHGDLTQLMRVRTAVLWVPLVLTYAVAIGLRAAFFMPSELPASWTFRFNGPLMTTAYWSATRASAIGFLLPLALASDAAIAPLVGVHAALWHASIVAAIAIVLAETVALSVDFVPFTRPYEPGHARLKTRWPIYLLGLFAFAIWPARAALAAGGDHAAVLQIAGWLLAAAAALEIAGRWRARTWRTDPAEEFHEESAIAVLDIGMTVPGAAQP
jgi:hypothetical protein